MRGLPVPPVLKMIVSRVIVLYLALIAGFFFLTDYKTVVRSAQLQTLSRLTPSFDYYQEFFQRPAANSVKSLQECLYYHKTVADLVPAAAGEAWGVAAFCAYELGRKKEAMSLIQKSIAKNPVFFWNHYNLGVMAFKEGDYKQAGNAFLEALHIDPKLTLYLLSRSKVYRDIHRSFGNAGYDLQTSLSSGYEQAMGLLQMSMACHTNSQAHICQDRLKLHIQLF